MTRLSLQFVNDCYKEIASLREEVAALKARLSDKQAAGKPCADFIANDVCTYGDGSYCDASPCVPFTRASLGRAEKLEKLYLIIEEIEKFIDEIKHEKKAGVYLNCNFIILRLRHILAQQGERENDNITNA